MPGSPTELVGNFSELTAQTSVVLHIMALWPGPLRPALHWPVRTGLPLAYVYFSRRELCLNLQIISLHGQKQDLCLQIS